MDIKREGVAKKKMIRRIVYLTLTWRSPSGARQLAALLAEAGRAHRGARDGLARHGEARAHGARVRAWAPGSRRHRLDSEPHSTAR